MKKKWLIVILPLLVLLWWGVDRRQAAPEIHFAPVQKLTIESTVPTNGKVEPVEWAAARAEIAGVVRAVDVQRGQHVDAGQPLVTLDTTQAESDLAAALAREEEARAEMTAAGHGGKPAAVTSMSDQIKTAQAAVAVAQREYDAEQRLLSQQAATQLQVQQAKDTLDRAKLHLAALEDQRRTLVTSSDRAVAQAKLREAEAAVALARHQIALGVIKSPLAGTVYQFDIKLGAYMQPGELVALVGKLDQVKVIVYVDEPDLGRVTENVAVRITWDAKPGETWWGRVQKLPTQVVALNTRAVGEVTTIVSNPNHDLLPGVTVNVTIISHVVKDALAIPKSALRSLHGQDGVFKLDGDSVVWTPVKVGTSDVNNVQILSGLKLHDLVADRVIEPSDAEIKNGMRVKPVSG